MGFCKVVFEVWVLWVFVGVYVYCYVLGVLVV